MAAPFKQAEFDIMFNEGISYTGDLLDLAVEKNVVQKSGSWFSYGEERLGQGREGVKTFLKENKELTAKIDKDVKVATGMIAEEPKKAGATAKDDSAAKETTAKAGAKASAKERRSANA